MLTKSEWALIGRIMIVVFLGAAIVALTVTFVELFIPLTQIEFDLAVSFSWVVWVIGLNFIDFKW